MRISDPVDNPILAPVTAWFGGKPSTPPPPPPPPPPPMIDMADGKETTNKQAQRRLGMRRSILAGESNQQQAAPVTTGPTTLG